jgi:hypothetical protein
MHVAKDLGTVRIVYDGSPFDVLYDIKVERFVNGEWKFYDGYNSLSNDYAFTAARESAARALKLN